MLDLKSLKSFDWRSLKKYASPKASEDLNNFLDKIPQNTNQTMLIIMGVVWGLAGATGLYTTVQLQNLTELRAELAEAKSLKPIVPKIVDKAVNPKQVSEFIEDMRETINSGGSPLIELDDSLNRQLIDDAVNFMKLVESIPADQRLKFVENFKSERTISKMTEKELIFFFGRPQDQKKQGGGIMGFLQGFLRK